MTNKIINIAIDGPAGAGKSTIARKIAKEIGFIYVDTGALYRAVGLYAYNNGITSKDIDKIIPLLKSLTIELKYENNIQNVYLNNINVSDDIRKPNISMMASVFSALKEVREFLFNLQIDIAKNNNIIMDGRDIGTVVLKNAQIKIFLTASVEDRAKRRYDEFISKGEDVNFDILKKEIEDRDYNDTHREIAPLRQASDAILIDTSGNKLEESVSILSNLIKEKLEELGKI